MATKIAGGGDAVPFSGFQFEVYTLSTEGSPHIYLPQGQVGFTSVSGLTVDIEAVEYKEGNSLYTDMLPGMTKPSEVTFERGLDKSGYLLKWHRQIVEATYVGQRAFRNHLIVVQYDRAGTSTSNPTRTNIVQAWKLPFAWPKSYSQGDLGANSEITTETVSMCFYGAPEVLFGNSEFPNIPTKLPDALALPG